MHVGFWRCSESVVVSLLITAAIFVEPACADLNLISLTFDQMGIDLSDPQFQPVVSQENNLGAFDIVITPGPALSGNAAAMAAFTRAANQWKAYISDPITVNVDANLTSLGPGILGNTSTVVAIAGMSTFTNAMRNDASADEAVNDAIVLSLPLTPSFTMPAGFSGDGNARVTKANAKALGFTGLGGSDGSITFSTNFNFDFDRSDGITPGLYDFESVAAHEIGHLLGFISSVDVIDGSVSSSTIQPTALDMFRFDNDGPNDPNSVADFATFPRSLVPGNDEVTDQIATSGAGDADETRMSTGAAKGDGWQATHWKDNLGLGLMDPTLGQQEISLLKAIDLRALDLIGYEITVVPEARAWLMLAAAALGTGCGAALKKRRAR